MIRSVCLHLLVVLAVICLSVSFPVRAQAHLYVCLDEYADLGDSGCHGGVSCGVDPDVLCTGGKKVCIDVPAWNAFFCDCYDENLGYCPDVLACLAVIPAWSCVSSCPCS